MDAAAAAPDVSNSADAADSSAPHAAMDSGLGSTPEADAEAGAASEGGATLPVPDPNQQFGGSRPVTVKAPSTYDPAHPTPLVILLHAYGVDGATEDSGETHLADEVESGGFLLAAPDGTLDELNLRFWNATDACCNYFGSTVDDVGYLRSLVSEIAAAYNVDARRVYLVGHSNGGYMAHRMACDAADVFAAIVSLAGAPWEDTSKCMPTAPISVLEINGTADTQELYDGGTGSGLPGDGPYPGALQTVEDWATFDGCGPTSTVAKGALDLSPSLAGNETDVTTFAGCAGGSAVRLWTMNGATHIPDFGTKFGQYVWTDFLSLYAKP